MCAPLVRDMARMLGTEGHVTNLRRLSVGPFHADAGVALKDLEALSPDRRSGRCANAYHNCSEPHAASIY